MIRAFLRIVINSWVCCIKTINNSRKLISMKVTIRILARPVFYHFIECEIARQGLILSGSTCTTSGYESPRNAPPERNVSGPHSLSPLSTALTSL